MATDLKLDLAIIEVYNPFVLTIADVSTYPTGKVINNSYIDITAPGFVKKTLIFTPRQVNIFSSAALDMNPNQQLPDGIWKLRYSIQPNYQDYTDKSYLKIDLLKEKFDRAFMAVDINECNTYIKNHKKEMLDEIERFIQAAMAAANQCNEKLALELYLKANKMLDKINC